MIKLCFISGDISLGGGTEKVACQIINNLALKYDIYVLSLTEKNKQMCYKLPPNVNHIALFDKNPNGIKQYISIVKRIVNFINKNNIDIVIDIDTILDMFSIPACKITNTKIISWEHFNFYESMGNKLRNPIRKYITKYSDCVITLTKEDKLNYENYFKGKLRIEQIYNPIEINIQENQYSLDSKTLISVGRLAKQKGFDYLIDVADLVFKKYPDWQWLILGEGDERKLLENKIQERNVTNVKLIGRVNNVGDYLKQSSIFVLTSRYEGFPLVLIEAKENHLPIVSFKCKTGPSELIKNNVNGYLIDCFNINSMANKIIELIESSETRKMFSNKALDDTDKMNTHTIIKQWCSVIESITKEETKSV